MEVNNINHVEFKGLWEPVRKLNKESGTYNRDKAVFTLYDAVYHPYKGETKEAIEEVVKKKFAGRSFSLWDKFDGQNKADMFQMNLVRIGEPINEADTDNLIGKGYKREFSDGILEENEFWEAYSNNTYEPCGISELSSEDIKDIANRHFNIKY